MPYAGTTYSELATAADQVEDQIAAYQERLRRATLEFSNISSSLQSVANEYGGIVGHSEVILNEQPNDPARIWLRSHILQLLSDFNALQTRANTLDSLVNNNP